MSHDFLKISNVCAGVCSDRIGAIGLNPLHKSNDLSFAEDLFGTCGAHGADEPQAWVVRDVWLVLFGMGQVVLLTLEQGQSLDLGGTRRRGSPQLPLLVLLPPLPLLMLQMDWEYLLLLLV